MLHRCLFYQTNVSRLTLVEIAKPPTLENFVTHSGNLKSFVVTWLSIHRPFARTPPAGGKRPMCYALFRAFGAFNCCLKSPLDKPEMNVFSFNFKPPSLEVAERSFQEPMPNSP